MEFHPSQIPVVKVFDVKDEKDAEDAVEEMIRIGFLSQKKGYKVLLPKESHVAKRIGYIITTGVNFGLRKTNQERDIRYWTYHHDKEHYAIVLIGTKAFDELDL
ncbi:MAG: hypothetical protein Q8O65_00770 [Nitrosopumilaceae archaeon]|nr:hypothetical protein [Nitrosopumilaceae archaeon]